MPTPINLPLPLKGVNLYGARSEQPAGTTPTALNVLPFDRYGRMRLAQRGGTGKLWNAAIGSGNKVQLIQQTVVGTDPASLDDSTVLVNEPFTYADGDLDATAAWIGFTNTFVASATAMKIATNQIKTNTGDGAAVYTPTPSIGTSYIVRYTMVVGEVANSVYYGLVTRQDPTTRNNNRLTVLIELRPVGPTVRLTQATLANAITPDSGTASITLPNAFFVVGQSYVVEIQWNGNNYVVKINGATMFSGTTTLNSAFSDVGFLLQASTLNKVDDFKVLLGTSRTGTPSGNRQTDIVAVSNGNIYMGNVGSQAVVVGAGTAVLNAATRPSAAAIFGKMYFVDGFGSIVKLDLLTRLVETYTPSAGLETTTTLGRYTVAAVWRGRLLLGADRFNPQNFIASKVGDPLNWDYTAGTTDGAFAGNASKAGRIGDPITALVPVSDDILLIGGDHRLWRMTGDIADGGSIDLVSDSIGVLGSTAWTQAPDGTVYFLGTTGFFSVAGGGAPLPLSDNSYAQFFKAINRSKQYVTLAWDRDLIGCHIYVTPVTSGTTTHLFWDAREKGFWPIQYPDTHGPISAMVYDGDDPTDRYIMLGGRTGFVQILSGTTRTDDGTAISANVILGPFQAAPPAGDSLITALDITAGEVFTGDSSSVWNMNWKIKAGKSAYEVTDGTARRFVAGNMGLAGRQTTRVPRIRGGWFTLELSNASSGNYFSVERAVVRVEPAGRQR